MPRIISTIKSYLLKNIVTLYAKFFIDSMLGADHFINYGKSLPKEKNRIPSKNPKKILFPTVFYLDRALAWQITIASALHQRGHDVVFMPLDLAFPACNALYFDEEIKGFISHYYNLYNHAAISGFGLPILPYSHFGTVVDFKKIRKSLDSLSFTDCEQYTFQSIPVGTLALNQLMHYYRCGTQRLKERRIQESYKDFIAIAIILHKIIATALDDIKPDIIFTLNGSFIDSQLQLILAKQRGIRVVTFEAGFMLNSLMLGNNEPIIDFPLFKYLPENYPEYTLTPSQDAELDAYLRLRSEGKDCVFDYWGKPLLDLDMIRKQLQLEQQDQPDILFTNLQWDSALLNCDIAFESQLAWIVETIKFYLKNPQQKLLIRIHPAEIIPKNLRTTDPILDSISSIFPELPRNITIIPPTSTISSFPLIYISKRVLVYSSTAGLESAIIGKKVIVSGKTHYRNMGFTSDITSIKQYLAELISSFEPSDKTKIIRESRRYAYFFFFGFMVPFNQVTEKPTTFRGEQVTFNFTTFADLMPGKDENLDFICDYLLDKTSHFKRLHDLTE